MAKESREQKLEWLRMKDFTERGEWVRFADVKAQLELHANLFTIYAKLVILAKLDKSLSCTVHEPGAFRSLPGLPEKEADVYLRILKQDTDICLFINAIAPTPTSTTLLVYFSELGPVEWSLWERIREHLVGDETEDLVAMLADVDMNGAPSAIPTTPMIEQQRTSEPTPIQLGRKRMSPKDQREIADYYIENQDNLSYADVGKHFHISGKTVSRYVKRRQAKKL